MKHTMSGSACISVTKRNHRYISVATDVLKCHFCSLLLQHYSSYEAYHKILNNV
jgi:hypothetical protein